MGLTLTTHFYLALKLRMSGAKPLLSYTPSWCGQGNKLLITKFVLSKYETAGWVSPRRGSNGGLSNTFGNLRFGTSRFIIVFTTARH
jgi:hypothetical protein